MGGHLVGGGLAQVLGELLVEHVPLEQHHRTHVCGEPLADALDLGDGGHGGQRQAQQVSASLHVADAQLVAPLAAEQGGHGAGASLADGGDHVVPLKGEQGALGGIAKPAIRIERITGFG